MIGWRPSLAGALGVTTKTISTDLLDFEGTTKSKRDKTKTNPKGSGRPKGSTKKDKPAPKPKLPWHRPRIVTVQANGPFRAFVLLTLFDNRTVIVADTPTVVNSTDVQKKAKVRELNCRYKAEQRQRDAEAKDEAKQYNKKNKHRHKEPDPVGATTVWLRKSERKQLLDGLGLGRPIEPSTRKESRELLADLKLGRPIDDQPSTRKELRKMEGLAATAAVRRGLRK